MLNLNDLKNAFCLSLGASNFNIREYAVANYG